MRDIFLCYLLALATALVVGWAVLVWKAADSRSGGLGCLAAILGGAMIWVVACILVFVAHQVGISSLWGLLNG